MSFIDELYEIESQNRNKNKKSITKIKTSQFCSISRNPKWYTWLGEIAPDLLDSLREQQKKHNSCRSNSSKMVDIQKELYKRKLSSELINFLKQNFPSAIGQTY